MSRYRKSMAEAMAEVEKKGQELPEVSPPGWAGSVKAMKKHKDIDNPWALAWHMKNKGDKPHYKDQDGRPEKKAKYKNEEVDTDGIVQLDEGKLPPHLAKFFDKKGNLNPDAAARVAAGRKKREEPKVKDVTPAGYGPKEERDPPSAKSDVKDLLDPHRKYKDLKKSLRSSRPFGAKKEEVEIDELSSDLLGRYKTKAAAQSSAAAKAGDHEKSHKRFKGITKATSKQFDNDAKAYDKRHEESEIDEGGAYGGGLKDAAKNLKKAEKRLGITPDKVTTTKSGVRKTTYKGKVDMGSVKKEDMDFKVKLRGLPAFYVPGKSAAAVRMMLRRQVKKPDDIEGVDRVTTAAKRKDFRLRGQGKSVEPKKDGE